jgi:dTDP-4-amino-4,6-dideoxygalactose transaminase
LDDYNIDLEDAERQITPRSRVLLLQHTFGVPVEVDAALALARRHNLLVIEDCVHALGARYDGRHVGTFGHAAFFSTEETKTLSTVMGGMAVTNDPDLALRMRSFQASCRPPHLSLAAGYLMKFIVYYMLTEPHLHRIARAAYERFGRRNPLPVPTTLEERRGRRRTDLEQRLSNGQAAVGISQLSGLRENLRHREHVANAYEKSLYEHSLLPGGLRLPRIPANVAPAYVRYPVWVEDRDTVMRVLARHVVVGTWFTSVLEEAEPPEAAGYVPGSCPHAEQAARHLINLPTHLRVTDADVRALTTALVQGVATSPSFSRH